MTISERIFDLLQKQQRKQADLVRAVGLRPNTVSDWKAKRRNPDVTHLASIADFFGVSIDYLCTGRETSTTPTVNQGIFGDRNQNNTVTIKGDGVVEISEVEEELLKICSKLDMRRKNSLLTYAYNLEKQMTEK